MQIDIDGYYDTAIQIIKRFDAIAPYEKYSGGNELEYSFMMEELRKMSWFSDDGTIELSDMTAEGQTMKQKRIVGIGFYREKVDGYAVRKLARDNCWGYRIIDWPCPISTVPSFCKGVR